VPYTLNPKWLLFFFCCIQLATATRCLAVRLGGFNGELPLQLQHFLTRGDITLLTQGWEGADEAMFKKASGMSGKQQQQQKGGGDTMEKFYYGEPHV
jgi:hypothetical protein